MMPEDSAYGDWPRSGEIDIMEARGNGFEYPGGRNIFFSTLHWGKLVLWYDIARYHRRVNHLSGPSHDTDAYWSTMSVRVKKRGDFSDGFHTYGLEW